MEGRLRNGPSSRRVFGKDITNLERRSKVHSISEKTTLLPEPRHKSRSFDKKPSQDYKDPILEYQHEILHFMLALQGKQKRQLMTNITPDMRHILIDWLIDVHQSFELKEQTLYLALTYLNEYSAHHQITKQEYQLVGIACLWIASKYEEIYPPRMSNYVQVTDSSYSIAELKAMEGKILLALNFNLTYTTPLQILQAVAQKWPKEPNGKLSRQSQKSLSMCKYIIELSLFESLGKEYCCTTLVLSAMMLADAVLKVKTEKKSLDEKVQKQTLMKCFKEMCIALQNASRPNLKLKALKKKFTQEKYLGIAKLRIEAR